MSRMIMSGVTPCLWFKDEAEEAARFYVSLRPNSRMEHIQKSPTDTPGCKAGAVLVVYFTIDGTPFMALNGGMAGQYTHAVSFSILCADQAELDRLWTALLEGGAADQCGWLRDRYGVSWQIVPAILPKLLAAPDEAKSQRVMQAMMQMVKLDIATLENA